MKKLDVDFNRCALGICAVAVILSGCGGSQSAVTPATPSLAAAHRIVSASSSYHIVYSWAGWNDGGAPYAGLVNVKGAFYSTTSTGGSGGSNACCGTVYSLSTSGAMTVLHRFAGMPDGRQPLAGLVNVKGTLYGTTTYGGSSDEGTVYRIKTSGVEKVLHSFGHGSNDGIGPWAGLVNINGTLYGTTPSGGSSNQGAVYSISTSGVEKVLYSFAGGSSDGAGPIAGLVNVNGTLYGTTAYGGPSDEGVVYSISTSGVEKVLYSFAGGSSDGANPYAGVIDVKGTLYGTTFDGGVFGEGTFYRVSASGAEKVLYNFGQASDDGAFPDAGLINVAGMLYGVTQNGGSYCLNQGGCGTVYSVSTSGVETVLHTFAGNEYNDGAFPRGALLNVNGTLYGTTSAGGGSYGGDGAVFALTL